MPALIPTQIDNNFTGRVIDGVLMKIYENTDFVKQFGIKTLTSNKSKFIITRVEGNFKPMRRVACPTASSGAVNIYEKQWSVGQYSVIFNIEIDALTGTLREKYLKPGVNIGSIEDDVELMSAIWAISKNSLMTKSSNMLMMGDESIAHPPADDYLDIKDGWIKLFQTDPLVVDVPSPVLANLSVSDIGVPNVLTEIHKLIAAIPRQLKYRDEAMPIKIAVSTAIYETYQNLRDKSLLGSGLFTDVAPSMIRAGNKRFELVPSFYMPENMMFAAIPDNLFIGVDAENDINNMHVTNQFATSSCKIIEVRIDWNLVPGYGFAEEITFYEAL